MNNNFSSIMNNNFFFYEFELHHLRWKLPNMTKNTLSTARINEWQNDGTYATRNSKISNFYQLSSASSDHVAGNHFHIPNFWKNCASSSIKHSEKQKKMSKWKLLTSIVHGYINLIRPYQKHASFHKNCLIINVI